MSVFNELRNYCPSGVISRIDLDRITGGMINHNTMAFLESTGGGTIKL